MDKLIAMRAFVGVVEAGTFTAAARSLGMSKSTVTRLVQTLESSLQVPLLERTTRSVATTPAGAAYYRRVVQLLGEIDEIESGLSG
jgi:DNA-binding transcriptional LysR family regulator